MRVFTPEQRARECDPLLTPYTVFLAGGITGCPDWQSDALDMLRGIPAASKWDVFNPRREFFDVSDSSASAFQIEWEHKNLRASEEVYFWFPKEGQCMITLLELGWALGSGKKIQVGCHPEYVRAFDVRKQVALTKGDDFLVHQHLSTLLTHVNCQYGMSERLRSKTGAPEKDCYKALDLVEWDFPKAVMYLSHTHHRSGRDV